MRPIDADKIVYSWQIDADGQEHDGVTLQSIIDKMPTIEPERKKGHWIIRRSPDIYHCGHRICSECGFDGVVEYDDYNFCPNCGTDMRGNPDE